MQLSNEAMWLVSWKTLISLISRRTWQDYKWCRHPVGMASQLVVLLRRETMVAFSLWQTACKGKPASYKSKCLLFRAKWGYTQLFIGDSWLTLCSYSTILHGLLIFYLTSLMSVPGQTFVPDLLAKQAIEWRSGSQEYRAIVLLLK